MNVGVVVFVFVDDRRWQSGVNMVDDEIRAGIGVAERVLVAFRARQLKGGATQPKRLAGMY